MATIATYTEEEVFLLALAYLQKAYPGKATHPRSFLGQQARAFAQFAGATQEKIKACSDDAIPAQTVDASGVIQSRCSTAALDAWAFTFGLPSNRGAGVFGRNGATAATGGLVTPTGTAGSVIPAGTALLDASGTVELVTVSTVTLPLLTPLGINATTLGAKSSLTAGTQLRFASAPLGVNSTVTLATGLVGGLDVESDVDLLARILRRLQSPPKGGTAADYREWAETAANSAGTSLGIVRAYVYPHREGVGSVSVVITQAGSGVGRDPGSATAAAVLAVLDKLRIATDTAYVFRPYFNPARKLSIRLSVVTTSEYVFDWTDSAPDLVQSYSGVSLVATGAVPNPALKSAIDNGRKPRIQLLLPGFGPLPVQRRVTAYAADTPVLGNHTLTLESALPAAPLLGDLIYAGGPAVDYLADATLAFVDDIGPSNQSGYADKDDSWLAIVPVSGIAKAVLNKKDSAGAQVALYSPKVGTGVGITLQVGAGPVAADDVTLYDNIPGQGPELPQVYSILVRAA